AAAQSGAVKLSGDSAGLALEKVPELSSAVAELYVGGGADIVAASKNLAEPRWTRLGVGALYAGSKESGPGRLWVVLLYGREADLRFVVKAANDLSGPKCVLL